MRGREELDCAASLAHVGLTVEAGFGEEAPGGWLGVNTRDEKGAVAVSSALAGGPAELAGLYAGDQIVALDGLRLGDGNALKERLAARKPGDAIELTLFRRDELRTVRVTLGARPHDKFCIVPLDDVNDAQKAAYQTWLEQPFPAEKS